MFVAVALALVGQTLPTAIGLSGTDLRAQAGLPPDVGSVGFGRGANEYWSEHLTPPDQVVAILAGRLFEARSGTMLTDQVVLIRGERIVAVGPDVDIPGGATLIDLSDATVLPGMIDTHVHVFPSGGTQAQRAFTAVANGLKNLNAGFTTVMNVDTRGGYGDVDMRDAISAGIILGPRMQVTGQSLNRTVTKSEGWWPVQGSISWLSRKLYRTEEHKRAVAGSRSRTRVEAQWHGLGQDIHHTGLRRTTKSLECGWDHALHAIHVVRGSRCDCR